MMQADKYCVHCDRNLWAECDGPYCPTSEGDYKDAAEFEARVAVKCAAWMVFSSNINEIERHTQFKQECLKIARLEVEEEMEK